MSVFDNCRICLQAVSHEPIKMTRSVLKFIETDLKMLNIIKQLNPGSRQNICAPCFNKFTDFQDFFELCKEADDFWRLEFIKSDVEKENSTCEGAAEADQLHINKELQINVPSTTTNISELPSKSINDSPLKDVEPSKENNFEMDFREIETSSFTSEKELVEYDYEIEEFGAEEEEEEEEEQEECEEMPKDESRLKMFGVVDGDVLHFIEEGNGETENHETYESIDEDSSMTFVEQESVDVIDDHKQENDHDCRSNFIEIAAMNDEGVVRKSYACKHCNKTFDKAYNIESHYNIHQNVKPFECEICGKSFRQKNILTTHQALHFGKKIECTVTGCGKKFARKSHLILHNRMHRDEKPFACQYAGCNAAFRQKQHLIDHNFIHSEEKKFECTVCAKAFHTRKRLQDHMYKVHSQHRYRCDLCDKAFLKPHMLKNHLLASHNMELNDVSHLKVNVADVSSNSTKQSSNNKN